MDRIDELFVVGEGPRIFALRRAPSDENARLVVRDGWHGEDRVLVDPNGRRDDGSHVNIDAVAPSPDGRRVAYALSRAGSEDATIYIVEVESGRVLADRIDRTQEPIISWRPDSRSFFYWRKAKRGPDWKPADYMKGAASYLHVIGSDPDRALPVIGAGMAELGLGSHDYTPVAVTPGTRWAVSRVAPTAAKFAFFVASLARIKPGRARWRKVAGIDDGVLSVAVHGNRLFALTHGGAPNYRIVAFDAKRGAIAGAKDFVPESELVLYDFVAARDAMYVVAVDRGIHRLFRVSWTTGARDEVVLPFAGSIRRLVSDPRRAGLVFKMEGWVQPPRWFRFDPGPAKVQDLHLVPSADPPQTLSAEEVTVSGRDGAEVPLSIIRGSDRSQDRSSPAILYAYGAYGETLNPAYNAFRIAWVAQGGIYAVCHVRGGGERGATWHFDGIRQKKENGVVDFIGCAEHPTRARYTRSDRLTAFGRSAGGIIIGGAVTKRPELFRTAVVQVGALNLLRVEAHDGPGHFEEFGNPTIETDFRSLLASDPYHRIRDGVAYPAVLVTAGIHDLRVPAWMPAKFAARLQAANHARPTLLRLDMDAGHGIGSTETQREEEYADIYAFALWQAGVEVR